MSEKITLTINKRLINPTTKVEYAYEIEVLGTSKIYAEDELNQFRRRNDVIVIDNSVEEQMVPNGTSYLANKLNDGKEFLSAYTGDLLKQVIKDSPTGKRDIFDEVYNQVIDKKDRAVVLLHGLRRTGKTKMLHQLIKQLIDDGNATADQIGLINVNDGSVDKGDISNTLEEMYYRGIKYVFIDEFTLVRGIISSSQYMHDIYSMRGVKVMLTGTSSFAINMLWWKSLATRSKMINMPPVSFHEHCRLINEITFSEYVKYGGIFTNDFKGFEAMKGYVYTSIVENISDTLLKNNLPTKLGASKEDVETIISKVIYGNLKKITVDMINKGFNTNFVTGTGLAKEQKDKIVERINNTITVNSNVKVNRRQLDEVMDALERIGVITNIENRDTSEKSMIIRFPGLVYSFWNSFSSTEFIMDTLGITSEKAEEISIRQVYSMEGQLIESTLLSELSIKYAGEHNLGVRNLNIENKLEVDITVSGNYLGSVDKPSDPNKKVYSLNLIEVKRGDKYLTKQVRWLVDNVVSDIANKYSKNNRIVLYNGVTEKRWIGEDVVKMKENDKEITLSKYKDIKCGYDEEVKYIYYVNIEEFLKNVEDFLFGDRLGGITKESVYNPNDIGEEIDNEVLNF